MFVVNYNLGSEKEFKGSFPALTHISRVGFTVKFFYTTDINTQACHRNTSQTHCSCFGCFSFDFSMSLEVSCNCRKCLLFLNRFFFHRSLTTFKTTKMLLSFLIIFSLGDHMLETGKTDKYKTWIWVTVMLIKSCFLLLSTV